MDMHFSPCSAIGRVPAIINVSLRSIAEFRQFDLPSWQHGFQLSCVATRVSALMRGKTGLNSHAWIHLLVVHQLHNLLFQMFFGVRWCTPSPQSYHISYSNNSDPISTVLPHILLDQHTLDGSVCFLCWNYMVFRSLCFLRWNVMAFKTVCYLH